MGITIVKGKGKKGEEENRQVWCECVCGVVHSQHTRRRRRKDHAISTESDDRRVMNNQHRPPDVQIDGGKGWAMHRYFPCCLHYVLLINFEHCNSWS